MSDLKENSASEVVDVEKKTAGNILSETRKSQGLKIEQIAKYLKLSVIQVQTIEADLIEGLPEPTYVRGYIRSYAKFLKLNEDNVLARYSHPALQNTINFENFPQHGEDYESSVEKARKPLIIIAVVALIIGLTYWLYGISSNSIAKKNKTAVHKTISNEKPTSKPKTVSTSNTTQEHHLAFTFLDESWVDVRDENNVSLAYNTYRKGQDLVITAKNFLQVFIGSADAVELEYNDKRFDLQAYKEGEFAQFSLGKNTNISQ